MHDELSGSGLDVFLDTHDIRPAEPFQEILWHRLAGCDVAIMLDTKDYFVSKWTAQELARSQALGILILRIIWPNHSDPRHLSLSDTISLSEEDLDDSHMLRPNLVTVVAKHAETLRSRSVAKRHLNLVGRLKSEVTRIGGKLERIGAYRSISLTLPNGKQIEAYPMIGLPTAEMMNDLQVQASNAGHGLFPFRVYNPHWNSANLACAPVMD